MDGGDWFFEWYDQKRWSNHLLSFDSDHPSFLFSSLRCGDTYGHCSYSSSCAKIPSSWRSLRRFSFLVKPELTILYAPRRIRAWTTSRSSGFWPILETARRVGWTTIRTRRTSQRRMWNWLKLVELVWFLSSITNPKSFSFRLFFFSSDKP